MTINNRRLNPDSIILRLICLTLSLVVLTSCGQGTSPEGNPSLNPDSKPTIQTQTHTQTLDTKLEVPQTCNNNLILNAFPDDVHNPVFINTPWDPYPGTELEYFLKNKGLACSYGIQKDEVGVTMLWVKGVDRYKELIPIWVEAGQLPYSNSDLGTDQIYIKVEGSKSDQTYKIVTYNMLYKGYWVQVSGTFFYSDQLALPIIRASLKSLEI